MPIVKWRHYADHGLAPLGAVQRWVFSEATMVAAVPRDSTAPLASACDPNGVR
jgi:hypothetical protein